MYKCDFTDNVCIVFVSAVKLCLHGNVFCETSADMIYKVSTNEIAQYIYIYIMYFTINLLPHVSARSPFSGGCHPCR